MFLLASLSLSLRRRRKKMEEEGFYYLPKAKKL